MATQTITRIDPIQYGKVLAVLMAICYAIMGILMTLFGVVIAYVSAIGLDAETFVRLGMVGGLLLTVAMVVFGLVCGFLTGVIGAFIYNYIARKIGGIKIELE